MKRSDLARSIQQLFDRETVARAGVYTLHERFEFEPVVAFLGSSPEGNAAVILPMRKAVGQPADRRTSGLIVRAPQSLAFEFEGRTWSEFACVIECVDSSLKRTFALLTADLLFRLASGRAPQWPEVLTAFAEWERLMRRRRVLSREDELGLWGELLLLCSSPSSAELLAAWRGPEAGLTDFFVAGVAFDVKATLKPGSVHVSHGQVALGGSNTFLVVLDAVLDPVSGTSVAQLVRDLAGRIEDPVELEEKLLSIGLSCADAEAYDRRYGLRRDPAIYRAEDVPQVRVMDPGVSDLRYRVELDPRTALPSSLVQSILPFLSLPRGSKEQDAPR